MNAFADHLKDLFHSWAPVHLKRMFGGYGVYRDERMFGLVADDTLYLKSDAINATAFDALGLPPFVFMRAGKPMTMSYRQAPAELYEDPAVAIEWAERAWEAALRVPMRLKKPARSPRGPRGAK